MMQRISAIAFFLLLAGSLTPAGAQQSTGCTLPEPTLTIHRANIFTAQQEQWLGEAQAERFEPHYLLLPESKSRYLTELGEKLLAQRPPTPVHYSFRIFESPEVRSFSLAGGHVYVSRKLILDAHNEDELAGALAQEIGRVDTHHAATVYTRAFDKLMGVKSIGDQADLNDKFQRMLNIPKDVLVTKWNPRLSIDEERSD
jgi:predicted Zn-dependent protease